MKQLKNNLISLVDLIGTNSAFGNDEGRDVFQKLSKELDHHPENKIFGISLKGLLRTDASFPRESIISLAKAKRGEIGFYLQDFEGKDLIDNWDYAAKAKEQPMIVFKEKGFDLIGPPLGAGLIELLTFIIKKDSVTTSLIAEKFEISSQNASGKLKKLHALGLLLSSKEIAETGGIEFVYKAISRPVKSA